MIKGVPDRNSWRALMRSALRIIDSLRSNGYGDLDFRLGGGTVLMFRFDHRISKDIDLFIDDSQALGFLSPRLNDIAAQEAPDYQEQSNTIKLFREDGDIDIIASGTVIRGEHGGTLDFEGRSIALEATSEILAKKMLFRAESFKARDAFDMAAALALDRSAAMKAIVATRSVHAVLVRRLSLLARVDADGLIGDIVMTDTGMPYAERMVDELLSAIAACGNGALAT